MDYDLIVRPARVERRRSSTSITIDEGTQGREGGVASASAHPLDGYPLARSLETCRNTRVPAPSPFAILLLFAVDILLSVVDSVGRTMDPREIVLVTPCARPERMSVKILDNLLCAVKRLTPSPRKTKKDARIARKLERSRETSEKAFHRKPPRCSEENGEQVYTDATGTRGHEYESDIVRKIVGNRVVFFSLSG